MEEFKPVKNEKVNTSIRLDEELLSRIDEVAAETKISRNELIVQCIEFSLNNYKSSIQNA